jgi:hypothetical protein
LTGTIANKQRVLPREALFPEAEPFLLPQTS